MRENLSRRAVTHTRQNSLPRSRLARIAASNTTDLRCRLYFVRLDATIIFARDHIHEVDFNVSRVPGQSPARVNSKSYRRVARNSQWGGCLGGLEEEPPAAEDQWGSGSEASSCWSLGVGGQSPEPPEARGSGGIAPSARKFCIFFAKITSF